MLKAEKKVVMSGKEKETGFQQHGYQQQLFPCAYPGCKTMRTAAEGGTTFTMCDEHFDDKDAATKTVWPENPNEKVIIESKEIQIAKVKYNRQIKGFCGTTVIVDVYRVLRAFNVVEPEIQHALKKLLCAGLRGKNNRENDLKEAILSIEKAIEFEKSTKTKECEHTHFHSGGLGKPDICDYCGKDL